MSDTASVAPPASVISTGTAATATTSAGGQPVASLPHLTREWMRLEEEITTLSAEIKSRRRRVKETRAMILDIMRTNSLGRLGVSSGHVVREEKPSKAAISKKYLNSTLVDFFEGDATRARACAEWIETHRPTKRTEILTIRPKED